VILCQPPKPFCYCIHLHADGECGFSWFFPVFAVGGKGDAQQGRFNKRGNISLYLVPWNRKGNPPGGRKQDFQKGH